MECHKDESLSGQPENELKLAYKIHIKQTYKNRGIPFMTYTYTICHLNAYFSNLKAKSTLNRRFFDENARFKVFG